MISNAHFWNAGARSYNPMCLNPLLVLEKITPLPGSSDYLMIYYKSFVNPFCNSYKNLTTKDAILSSYWSTRFNWWFPIGWPLFTKASQGQAVEVENLKYLIQFRIKIKSNKPIKTRGKIISVYLFKSIKILYLKKQIFHQIKKIFQQNISIFWILLKSNTLYIC